MNKATFVRKNAFFFGRFFADFREIFRLNALIRVDAKK